MAHDMQMEAVLDTVGEGIIAVDESLNIVMVNQEAVNIWRCGHNELIGENLQMLIKQENRDKIGNGLVPDLNGASSMLGQWMELEGLRKDGSEFPLEINISQTKIGERLLFTAAVRDITSRKQAEERILAQERLASVGQLAAGIAHDFNNMLTVMTGFAEILRMRSDISDYVKGRLEVMIQQGKRAAQLISQILDFSRKTVAERQPTDLEPFLKEAVNLFDRTMPETIQVVTEVRRGNYIVNANMTQLQQAITNLAVNARDAMPEGGELRIGLSLLRLEPGDSVPIGSSTSSIAAPDVEPGNWVVLKVSDTGVGMPPEVVSSAHLRAVLHDQTTRKGDRSWTGPDLRHREAARRVYRRGERSRKGYILHNLPTPSYRGGHPCGGTGNNPLERSRGDDPDGGGRSSGWNGGQGNAGAIELPGGHGIERPRST